MRRPPPLARIPAYPVTAGIGLMAVAVTVMTLAGRWSLAPFEVTPAAFHGQPWRLLTSVLPHLDVFHILFNVYWLWAFGTLVEEAPNDARAGASLTRHGVERGSDAARQPSVHGCL